MPKIRLNIIPRVCTLTEVAKRAVVEWEALPGKLSNPGILPKLCTSQAVYLGGRQNRVQGGEEETFGEYEVTTPGPGGRNAFGGSSIRCERI